MKEVVSSVLFITDSMKISRLLHLLQQNKAHMAVVTDEYGGTAGIVTLEDAVSYTHLIRRRALAQPMGFARSSSVCPKGSTRASRGSSRWE